MAGPIRFMNFSIPSFVERVSRRFLFYPIIDSVAGCGGCRGAKGGLPTLGKRWVAAGHREKTAKPLANEVRFGSMDERDFACVK